MSSVHIASCPGLASPPDESEPNFKVQELSKKLSFCLCTSQVAHTQSVPLNTQTHLERHRDTHVLTHARSSTLGPTQIPRCLSSSSKDILGSGRMTNLGTGTPSKQMSVQTRTCARTHSHPHSGRHRRWKHIPGDGFMGGLGTWRRIRCCHWTRLTGLSFPVDSHFRSASSSSEGTPVTQQVLFVPHVGIQLKCKFSLSW